VSFELVEAQLLHTKHCIAGMHLIVAALGPASACFTGSNTAILWPTCICPCLLSACCCCHSCTLLILFRHQLLQRVVDPPHQEGRQQSPPELEAVPAPALAATRPAPALAQAPQPSMAPLSTT
jgi:hypothetical protein